MEKSSLKIGIIGCGTIGSFIAEAIEDRFGGQAKLTAVCDINSSSAQKLIERCRGKVKIAGVDELISLSDLVVEAASAKAAYDIAQKTVSSGKDILIMSVGGILEKADTLFSMAQEKGCRIYLPSGAIGGLDAIKSASAANIKSVSLLTKKPLKGLSGAPYLQDNKIELESIKGERIIFQGNAIEAIKGFPKNVNVCALLSLAGVGPEKTKVTIMTSPDYRVNSHQIDVEGDFGKLTTRTENVPSPTNPKTSFLAALSAIATIDTILKAVKIGT